MHTSGLRGHHGDMGMESSHLGRYVLLKLDEMIGVVAGMDDREANAVPDLEGANSAYQILEHCLGMIAEWTRANILGEPVDRDRDAEFEAEGSVAELVERAGRARQQLVADLERMEPGAEAPGRPGKEAFWAHSVDGILLHVLEELCQHLGHLEITRDVVHAGRRPA